MKIKCCGKIREGQFCNNCGCRLDVKTVSMTQKLNEVKQENNKLKQGILYYIEAYHKKMAGSTIQFSIKDLEKLIKDVY